MKIFSKYFLLIIILEVCIYFIFSNYFGEGGLSRFSINFLIVTPVVTIVSSLLYFYFLYNSEKYFQNSSISKKILSYLSPILFLPLILIFSLSSDINGSLFSPSSRYGSDTFWALGLYSVFIVPFYLFLYLIYYSFTKDKQKNSRIFTIFDILKNSTVVISSAFFIFILT